MSRVPTEPPFIPIRIQDITSPISPSRLGPYRSMNPEITPLRQNKSDIYVYGAREDNITSPFQKDQFLNERPHHYQRQKLYAGMQEPLAYDRMRREYEHHPRITHLIPQVVKMEDIPSGKEGLSKSWTPNREHRETVTYL